VGEVLKSQGQGDQQFFAHPILLVVVCKQLDQHLKAHIKISWAGCQKNPPEYYANKERGRMFSKWKIIFWTSPVLFCNGWTRKQTPTTTKN
jgi:hypothetical protein